MVKKIILAACLLGFIFSCKTAEQKARKHIEKAIRLYPKIISTYTTDTTITIYVPGDTITIPADTARFNLVLDSLIKTLSKSDTPVVVYKDRIKVVTITKGKGNSVDFSINQKPDTIKLPGKTITKTVTLPGKAIEVGIDKKPWLYWWFWLLILIIAGETILLFRRKT